MNEADWLPFYGVAVEVVRAYFTIISNNIGKGVVVVDGWVLPQYIWPG